MRDQIKNGARVALVVAGFAVVTTGIANAATGTGVGTGVDTVGARSHLAVASGGTAGTGLNGNAAGQVGGARVAGGGDLGTAASNGLSLSRKGLRSSSALCGGAALASIPPAVRGNAELTHHLGTGLAGSGLVTGRRGNAVRTGSSLLP